MKTKQAFASLCIRTATTCILLYALFFKAHRQMKMTGPGILQSFPVTAASDSIAVRSSGIRGRIRNDRNTEGSSLSYLVLSVFVIAVISYSILLF